MVITQSLNIRFYRGSHWHEKNYPIIMWRYNSKWKSRIENYMYIMIPGVFICVYGYEFEYVYGNIMS